MGSLGNSGVFESEAISVLVFWLSDGAKEMYMTFIASEMSTGAHVYHRTLQVVRNQTK